MERTKFRRKTVKANYSYWFDEPKQPYLELPDKDYYDEAIRHEENRVSGYRNPDPISKLDSLIYEIKLRVRITKNEIFKIGELLCFAKPLCQQTGIGFQDWIKKNFEFSYETAKNFMNVYEQCMGIRDIAILLPASVLYRISSPGFPEALRAYLLERGHLDEISCNHVDKLLKKYREGGCKIEAIEGDLNEINRRYHVFRQTYRNLQSCERALNQLKLLQEKLLFPYAEVDWNNPEEMQPEAADITRRIFDTFSDAIKNFKATIKQSNEKLYKCQIEIGKLKSNS